MFKKIKKHIALTLELGKVKITFFVAVSTSVGYVFHSGKIDLTMFLIASGVFLLACGSSALNHYQERLSDALMDRTKGRPIPSGRVLPLYALLTSAGLTISGLIVIYLFSNVTSAVLGVIALIWYNIIYTPLKKKYALAVVPGSVIGAIPPIIGWTASGGSPFDLTILSLAFFFFIWQIPHFWLLLLLFNKDYEKAGFPTLTKIFTNLQLGRITFTWIAALATSCIMIPLYSMSSSIYAIVVMVLLGIWLLFETSSILSEYLERVTFRKAFLRINLYVLAVVLVISLDKLLI